MENNFTKSLNSLKESNGEFFLVNIGRNNQPIKIVVDPAAAKWVKHYKYNLWEYAVQNLKKDGDDAFLEKYVVLHYFYQFVIPDILKLRSLLPEKMAAALNIGAGIGLNDVFLYQYYDGDISLTLTELDMMFEITNVDGSSVPLNEPLNTLELLGDVVRSNGLKNCDVVSSKLIGNHTGKKFDFVFSFRSWGYLYDLDEYLPFVDETLSENGVVITDLSDKYGSVEKFNEHFMNCRIIQQLGNGNRWIGHRK